MLNTDAKRTINNARDILVGKVPNPQSQVDLITVAMIYKFMDDMDLQGLEFSGGRTFFKDDLEQYAFSKLMDPKLGAQARMNLYVEALEKLPFAKSVPELFRTIFKGAFLPFRDPQTLNLFLKEIANFSYDNSENLGNAFEYLLSIMGSQGDAGQFRTPRHIIDFIIDIVKPSKTDTILDPACGTAGFLISAYLYIKRNNKNMSVKEMQALTNNIVGYDISPDMRKLALVNLYLHKFAEPKIYEYDTLTQEERWGDKFDVIFANPPFMTPKGGIQPHNKFSVNANRSEVLFVDYIAEHLTINGRAGIIVPEGIIFQSATAYKALRKMLIDDNYLYAVISLPAGVFNPYSGVKTSILLFDRAIAKQRKDILFVRVDKDGLDLGAQRKSITANDLPEAVQIIEDWKTGKDTSAYSRALVVPKTKIAENGEYILTAGRYQSETTLHNCGYEIVKLGDISELISGYAFKSELLKSVPDSDTDYPVVKIGNITANGIDNSSIEYHSSAGLEKYIISKGDILLAMTGATVGKSGVSQFDKYLINQRACIIRGKPQIDHSYLACLLGRPDFYNYCQNNAGGGAQGNISPNQILQYKLPLPPLEVQRSITDEIRNKQTIIDHALGTIKSLERERLYFASLLDGIEYEQVALEDICEQITDGTHQTPTYTETGIPFLRVTDLTETDNSKKFISKEEHKELLKRCYPKKGDILLTKNGTIGIAKVIDWDYEFSIFVSLCLIKPKSVISNRYLAYFLNSPYALEQMKGRSKSGVITNLHLVEIKQLKIPLPSIANQERIVAALDEEQGIINTNKRSINLMQKKIDSVIKRIYKCEE
ncbi:MAG: N-6 DNA methylase [Endomicrobia bacterium]|nr:N-6 DNA methylase [Endomicrobiia bacterium]